MNEKKEALEIINGLANPVRISVENVPDGKYVLIFCENYSKRCELAKMAGSNPRLILNLGVTGRKGALKAVSMMSTSGSVAREYKLFNLAVAVCKSCVVKRLRNQK